jgi:hypothetical protein
MTARTVVLAALVCGGLACGGEAVMSTPDAAPEVGSGDALSDAESGVVLDAPPPYDAKGCILNGASYDQSCTQDTDCVAAAFGNVCTGGCYFLCDLGSTAINAKETAQYNAAIASAPEPASGHCSCGSGVGAGFQGSAAFCEGGHCVGGYRQPGGD